jgi:D-glycero-D-manno-heptose 1,7-bisphosphate phosphatase
VAKPAIFLDRNGLFKFEADSLHKGEDLDLIPGVGTAISRLNDLGLFCCLIDHQLGLARKDYPLESVDAFYKHLSELLYTQAKAKLDAIYYCPYLSPTAGGVHPKYTRWSTWGKPNTGMLIAAAWEHNLNLQQSFVIGEEATDIDLAHNVGAKGILIQSGYSKKPIRGKHANQASPDHIATDLNKAIIWISDCLGLSS